MRGKDPAGLQRTPHKHKRWRRETTVKGALVLAIVALAMGLLGGSASAATTWHVNTSSSGSCTAADPNCSTIQAAVDAASSGDTIDVAAGTYAERVTIDKSLTLDGAQANVTPVDGGRSGGESTIANPSPGSSGQTVIITANGVTVNGFEIKDFYTGIDVRAAAGQTTTNVNLEYNWLHSTYAWTGIQTGEDLDAGAKSTGYGGFDHIAISNNLIDVTADGISQSNSNCALCFTQGFTDGVAFDNVEIDANVLHGDPNGGNVIFAGANPWQYTMVNPVITGNTISDAPTGINMGNMENAEVSGNTFSDLAYVGAQLNVLGGTLSDNVFESIGPSPYCPYGSTYYPSWDLQIWGNPYGFPTPSHDVRVTGNDFHYNGNASVDCPENGGRVDDPATGISFNHNNFLDGGASASAVALQNNATSTADGTCNWWSDASGPSGAGSGSGGAVSANLTVAPWLVAPAPDGLCTGGAGPITTTVSPSNMNGWGFFDDNGYGGTGQMVTGPATPPLGVGSAELGVSASDQGYALGTVAYDGTMLADITQLAYSSYQAGPTLAIALQFGIHYTATSTGWQGRLVFEPYQNGHVTVGSGWQTWSPLDGVWWASGSPGNSVCPISSPCTWSQVLTLWPGASINGALLFKAGSGWTSFTGNVDALEVGVQQAVTLYDFEPNASPAQISGSVVDQNNQPISDATATLLWSSSSTGPFTPVSAWPGGTAQANPMTTDSSGHFDWQVTAGSGYYEVAATARMCGSPVDPAVRSATSSVVSVPPDATGVTVQLVCYPVTIESASYNPTPVTDGPAGVYTVTATFTNTSSNTITHPYFTVTKLTNGNLLLNADGGPGGVGSTLTPSDATLGGDGIVSPGESVTQEFQIGLATPAPFEFLLDVSPGS